MLARDFANTVLSHLGTAVYCCYRCDVYDDPSMKISIGSFISVKEQCQQAF